ncbi:hypothetical protein D7Z54_24490 [Salibacterium salarium]|uniref:Uncharacterized protein n=1 Tax=Salibacterium salarium TaxID=284579 RepID=A0A428MXH5_9BACI|nr:DUF6612 family protein [Salibacterium salarium]RSL30796.1 hypothetical protein D7Z54_24490 [Salibacterium salarium]
MDKLRVGMLILVLAMFSAACMSEAETNDENGEKEVPSEPEEEPDESDNQEPEEVMAAEDVLQQSINKMEDLQSYTIDTNMNQHIQLNKEESLKNKYRSNTAVNLDPVRYHESSTIEKTQTDPMNQDISLISLERYFTEEGFYIFDSTEGRWTKFPDQFTQDFQSYDDSFENPQHILEMIETYNNDIAIEEGNRHYQLTFRGDNDQTQQIALQMIGMVNTEFSSTMEDMMYMTEIADLEYELQIDKETLYAKKLKMNLTMNMNTEEGEAYQSNHVVVAHYSDLAETEEVSVPSHVLNQAEEMEIHEFSGFDDMEEFDTIDGMEMDELYDDNDGESTEDTILDFDLSEYLNGGSEEDETDEEEPSLESDTPDEPK